MVGRDPEFGSPAVERKAPSAGLKTSITKQPEADRCRRTQAKHASISASEYRCENGVACNKDELESAAAIEVPHIVAYPHNCQIGSGGLSLSDQHLRRCVQTGDFDIMLGDRDRKRPVP